MIPDPQFIGQPKTFWATVRAISEESGYTARGTGQIKIHSINSMVDAYNGLGLDQRDIVSSDGSPNQRGQNLLAYFNYRARVLNTFVESNLMDVAEAASLFSDYRARLAPSCPLPMNKQTGEKKAPAYLTGLVNMLVEANSKGLPCNYDPKQLTAITKHNRPLRTLARRVDGAFPSTIDPIAVWEIKEYYYLQLDPGLMGFFTASFVGSKRVVITTDIELAKEAWGTMTPRKSKLSHNLGHVNEQLGIVYPILGDDQYDKEDSKPLQLFTRAEFEELLAVSPHPFQWAPGLLGNDMNADEFRELISSVAEKYDVQVPK